VAAFARAVGRLRGKSRCQTEIKGSQVQIRRFGRLKSLILGPKTVIYGLKTIVFGL